jgi:hypothetical protein
MMGRTRRAPPQLAEPDLADAGGFPSASGEDGDQVVVTGGDAIHIVTLRHRVASPARGPRRRQRMVHSTRLPFSDSRASAGRPLSLPIRRRRADSACPPGSPG